MDDDDRGRYATARYQIISALLQADGPLTLPELEAACRSETDTPRATLLAVLKELVDSAQVVQGVLLPDRAAPQYAWRARWEQVARVQTDSVQQDLRSALDAAERIPPAQLDVDSQPSTTFYRYVIGPEYHPPDNKRYLVFLQCSVRRPFSTAPSHAPMRRAIRIATGYDPRTDLAACPVHVVVLASKIGPVPYELEDLYPANVRGGGVKHFDLDTYERVKPVLADRMAHYILTYSEHYQQITSFTQGRYAEVLHHARKLAVQQGGPAFNILPQDGGAIVTRMNKSKPHQYWARYWIQLYLEIVDWLAPEQQRQARARLHKLEVEYRA